WLAAPMPDSLRHGLIGLALAAVLLTWAIYRVLLRMVLNPLLDSGHLLRGIAAGDLTTVIEVWTRDEIGQLFQGLKDTQDSRQSMIAMARERTGPLVDATRDHAAGNQVSDVRTQPKAGTFRQTAASTEALASSTRQTADTARQAIQLAGEASGVAASGGQ